MNFQNENIGHIIRTSSSFTQTLDGKTNEFARLPPIMCDIAPAGTQFPEAQDVLEYYDLERLDVWKYLARSNGFKSSRNVWFMAEPLGEVWIPLVLGMQRYESYDARCRIGDIVRVLMNGQAVINRHTMDILPACVVPYLRQDGTKRYSTAEGYVKDLVPYPSINGMVGRVVIDFGK